MVEPMVVLAQREQVGGVGGSAVLPMDDVVDVEPPAALASRDPAAPVPVLDHHPGALGHGAEGPPHADRLAPGLDDRPHPGCRSSGSGRSPSLSAGPEVEMAAAVGPLTWSSTRWRSRWARPGSRRRPVGHRHQGVGPRDVGRTGGPRLDLAGAEQLVAGRPSACSTSAPSSAGSTAVSRQAPLSVGPKLTWRTLATGRSVGSATASSPARCLEHVAAESPAQLADRRVPGQLGHLGVDAGRDVTANDRHLFLAQLPRLEGGPGLGQLDQAGGHGHQPPGPPRRHPALPATHCAGERMPATCHDPVSSSSAISLTSRPVAALMMPHTSAISPSMRSDDRSRLSDSATLHYTKHTFAIDNSELRNFLGKSFVPTPAFCHRRARTAGSRRHDTAEPPPARTAGRAPPGSGSATATAHRQRRGSRLHRLGLTTASAPPPPNPAPP